MFLFLTGLTVGSFINAQVFRFAVANKLSVLNFQFSKKTRSVCDFCGEQLRWFENIPVVSWLVLGGKSRCCHKKLSGLYPIVELLTGMLFLIFFQKFGQVANLSLLLLGMSIIGFLVFSAVFDLKYMILPDFSTISLVVLALLFNYFRNGIDISLWMPYLISGLVLFLFFLSLYFLTKKKGMGLGDVKLSFFIGLFLGWPKTLVAFYVAFLMGAVVAIFLMLFAGFKRKSMLPFGPFLILATLIVWFWGERLWNLFLKLVF